MFPNNNTEKLIYFPSIIIRPILYHWLIFFQPVDPPESSIQRGTQFFLPSILLTKALPTGIEIGALVIFEARNGIF